MPQIRLSLFAPEGMSSYQKGSYLKASLLLDCGIMIYQKFYGFQPASTSTTKLHGRHSRLGNSPVQVKSNRNFRFETSWDGKTLRSPNNIGFSSLDSYNLASFLHLLFEGYFACERRKIVMAQ
ncbi:hypothetical protein AJ79_07247 [Helicocarpus griseus UAMH5409]|uniref:Uncharacterized protein n=1 Tax=Helicocarpus griseus UAMH5409 TaxID=1447875 RepID=A0A2B7X4S5_9EURO|nr:hypothetical protein AJ79_07247 [Helicocarpus griseus UAMH5409]